MSKAEDLAEKLYPKKENVSFGPLPCEEPNVIDDNKPYRIGFIAGYKQAEKDNEITWEDIEKVFDLCYKILHDVYLMKFPDDKEEQKEFYQEVLKRFKEKKMQNDLLNRVNEIRSYIQKMIVASENNAKELRAMKERGFSQEGMLDKVIEVTSIQSEQIKTLATIALYVTKSDKFVSDMAISMVMEHEERKEK